VNCEEDEWGFRIANPGTVCSRRGLKGSDPFTDQDPREAAKPTLTVGVMQGSFSELDLGRAEHIYHCFGGSYYVYGSVSVPYDHFHHSGHFCGSVWHHGLLSAVN